MHQLFCCGERLVVEVTRVLVKLRDDVGSASEEFYACEPRLRGSPPPALRIFMKPIRIYTSVEGRAETFQGNAHRVEDVDHPFFAVF